MDGYGIGWLEKNAHITALALTALLCGPSNAVMLGGIWGPPGHSCPSPIRL
jgi:hypothetical protein